VTPLLPQVLNVVGQSRVSMRYGVLCVLVLPAAFYVLGRLSGTAGLALVWVLVFPVLTVPAYWRVLQAIELPSREYLAALWPATSASVLMVAAVLLVKLAANGHVARGLSFGLQAAAGAGAYTLACVVLHGERLASLARVLRSLRAAPRPVTEGSASP